MSAFPVHAVMERDFVVQLVLVDSEDTMDQVAEKVAYHCINRRVKARKGIMRVRRHRDIDVFPQSMKVSESGLRPTDIIDVVFEG